MQTQTAPVQAQINTPTVLTPALLDRIHKGIVGTLKDLRYSGNPKFNPVPRDLRLTCAVPIDGGESLRFTFEIRSDLALLIRPKERAAEVLRLLINGDIDGNEVFMTLDAAVQADEWRAA